MAGMICPYCKLDYPSDYKWCMEDGSELEQNMGQFDENADGATRVPCPECGEPVDIRDIYCGSCATKLEGRLPQPEAEEEEYEEPQYEEYNEAPAPPIPAAPAYQAPPQDLPTRPCPKCGTEVALDDTFCGGCGAPLESAIPASDWTTLGRACPHCAGGLDPEDTFCGSCGHSVEPEVAPAAPSVCESCGMEVSADDTFCGTCGAPVQQQSAAPVEQYQESAAHQNYAPAVEQSYAGASEGGPCPNCGMDAAPGEAFCGTCGAQLSGGQGGGYQEEPAPLPSISDFTKDIAVCPSCGIPGEPGQTTCITCGVELTTEGNLQPGAPSSFNSFGESEDLGAPGPAPLSGGSGGADGEKICSCCGVSSPPEAEFCGNCGIDF